jgi:F-type H+-transporting ATPase subunit b
MPQFDPSFWSSVIFWSLVSFGVLLLLLKKYALPELIAILEAREKTIRDSLEQAERVRREAEEAMAQYQAKLKAAQQEAQALIDAARQRAAEEAEANEQRARQEAQRLVAEARSEIDRERLQALRDIRNAAVDLTIGATEKILERNLTAADHRRMVEEAVDAMARQAQR